MTKDKIEINPIDDNSDASYSLENNGVKGERKIRSVRALQFESVRLETFYYFKYKNTVDVNRLAKRGFYYNRRSDTVCCLFCPTELQKSDNYEEPPTHARDDDKCKMTIFPLNGNVPQVGQYVHDDFQSKLNDMLESLMTYKVNRSFLYKETVIDFYSGFTGDEDFSNYDVRLSTFDNWFEYLPEEVKPKKERYAEAGFVYTGFTDIVMCFNCKGGFFNIDKDDDPLKDHARYFGHCSFMVDSFHGKGLVSEWGCIGMPGTSMMYADMPLMVHPLIQNLIIMQGYEKNFISEWIYDYVKIYGCYPFDIESCIKEVEKSFQEKNAINEEENTELEKCLMEEEKKSLVEKGKIMEEREKAAKEREKRIEEKEKRVEEEEKRIEEEENRIKEEEKRIEEEEKRIEEEEKLIEEEEKRIEEEEKLIEEEEKRIEEEEKRIEEEEKSIEEDKENIMEEKKKSEKKSIGKKKN